MKLSEVAQRQAQHLIVFGDPKVGKSELVGELTKYFNLFWFSLMEAIQYFINFLRLSKKRFDL